MKKYIFLVVLFSLIIMDVNSDEGQDRGYIVKVGDQVPEFVVKLTDGSEFSNEDFKGKITMLQFTASWCSVCRKEMPVIEKEIWKIYKDKGLVLIGIDRDEPLEVVQEFAKKMGITYPLALDPEAGVFAKFAHIKSGITRNVIIDKNGKIVFLSRLFERREFDEMKEVIRKLLES